jgi:hypothetical protein
MDENLAGILGLLIGGAGGYYGGKKRGEREDKKLADYFDMMKELEGGSDGTTNTVPEVDLGPTEVPILGEQTEMLVDALPNTQFGSTVDTYDDPLAEYFRDDDKAINTEDLVPLLENTAPIYGDPNSSFKESFGPGLEFLFGLGEGAYTLPQAHDFLQLFKADGGRVGLANGGLGYSYKNNIFSADPSTGIPAVVDAGGVANNTFMDLYPGMLDDATEEDITSMPPILPLLTGGGGQMMKSENDYSANPDGTIGFQNSAYDGILGGEYKDRPIGDEFTLGTSPLSDYGDIFNPNEIGVPSKKKGFFDAYGKFVGSDDMPLGTLPGAQFQDFMTDDEGNFDYSKVIPGLGVVKTLDNLLSNILGFKTDTDPDPEQYDKVKDPMKAFKDMSDAAKQQGVMTEKELAAEAAEAREKLKSFSKGEGGGGGKGFGGANVGDHSPGRGTARF